MSSRLSVVQVPKCNETVPLQRCELLAHLTLRQPSRVPAALSLPFYSRCIMPDPATYLRQSTTESKRRDFFAGSDDFKSKPTQAEQTHLATSAEGTGDEGRRDSHWQETIDAYVTSSHAPSSVNGVLTKTPADGLEMDAACRQPP